MSEHFQNQIKNRRKIPLADIYMTSRLPGLVQVHQ